MNSVSPALLSGIVYASSAFAVWSDLRERFSKVDGSRIYQLHTEIAITQLGTDSIGVYFDQRIMLLMNTLLIRQLQPTLLPNLPLCEIQLYVLQSSATFRIRLHEFPWFLQIQFSSIQFTAVQSLCRTNRLLSFDLSSWTMFSPEDQILVGARFCSESKRLKMEIGLDFGYLISAIVY